MINISIETDNLIIRPFLPSDAKDAAYYSQQPNVAYWMSDMVLHVDMSDRKPQPIKNISKLKQQIEVMRNIDINDIKHRFMQIVNALPNYDDEVGITWCAGYFF
jgi:hypothetical protein